MSRVDHIPFEDLALYPTRISPSNRKSQQKTSDTTHDQRQAHIHARKTETKAANIPVIPSPMSASRNGFKVFALHSIDACSSLKLFGP